MIYKRLNNPLLTIFRPLTLQVKRISHKYEISTKFRLKTKAFLSRHSKRCHKITSLEDFESSLQNPLEVKNHLPPRRCLVAGALKE